MEIVQSEGDREVAREVELYNLDAIIAVGYRVSSYQATQFRIWATKTLREFMIKADATKLFMGLSTWKHAPAFGTIPEMGAEKVVLRDEVSVITAARADQASLEEQAGSIRTA